jgi:hypothetical protein
MNKKHIFLLVVSMVPLAMKGMAGDVGGMGLGSQEELKKFACGNDACRKEWTALNAQLATQPSIDTEAHVGGLMNGRNVSHLHQGEATGFPNTNVSTQVKNRFDLLLDPSAQQPSFFSKFGNQFAVGFAITIGGLVASSLFKEYMTPKSLRDAEAAHTTRNEQDVLFKLESDIEKMIRGIPATKKELETAKDPDHIAYLKDLISKAEEQLQRKLELHKVLSQKFSVDQARRFGVPLNRQVPA